MTAALTPHAALYVAAGLYAVVALAAWTVRRLDARACRFANETGDET